MKIITKNIHDRLDNFVYENKNDKPVDDFKQEDNSSKKKIIKKKQDGLIEKLDNKIIISEDNRKLLSD